MYVLAKLARVVGFAAAGACVGAVLAVVIVGLLGGLATIPQVDWRHSDAIIDVAGNTIMVGLIFGTLLGAPVGAVIGLVTGAIVGLRSPATRGSSACSVSTGPSGKSSKSARLPEGEFGSI